MNKIRKGYDKFFLFFNYYSRIIHEYFQDKFGRKMRIFSLARKNNILIY